MTKESQATKPTLSELIETEADEVKREVHDLAERITGIDVRLGDSRDITSHLNDLRDGQNQLLQLMHELHDRHGRPSASQSASQGIGIIDYRRFM